MLTCLDPITFFSPSYLSRGTAPLHWRSHQHLRSFRETLFKLVANVSSSVIWARILIHEFCIELSITADNPFDMSQPAGGPGFGPIGPFDLTRFMKRDDLTPEDKVVLWRFFDKIFDNLVDNDGNTRSLGAIKQVVQNPLSNPQLSNNTLLTGVNLAQEVQTWCSFLQNLDMFNQGVAKLGQSKTVLTVLDQYLTVPERENRQSNDTDESANRTPLPTRLVKSWSDKLALLHWARVRNNQPVNPPPHDIPKTFEEADVHADKIFDGMRREPDDMVENLIMQKKAEKANKKTEGGSNNNDQPDGDDNKAEGNPDDNKAEGNPDAKKADDQEKKIHPQAQRARDMSDLSLYVMSWELYVSFCARLWHELPSWKECRRINLSVGRSSEAESWQTGHYDLQQRVWR